MRESILQCFKQGLTIRQTEWKLSIQNGTIMNRYPDVHEMFERRRYVNMLTRDAMIVEEWVLNDYSGYDQVRHALQRKGIMETNNSTIKDATSRYLYKPGTELITITLESKL